MPTISMFFGIIIRMYYDDHIPPHFHAFYQEYEAMFALDGAIIKGEFPAKQAQFVTAWALIHQDELEANWKLSKDKQEPYKIAPLR